MPTLEITTMVGCSLMCEYCPQDNLKAVYGKSDKYLSLENFRTILHKVPSHIRIDFSGMAEPWINPDCTQMLQETLEAGRSVAVYTTLYGMDEDGEVVADLLTRYRKQVEVLCLHLPDANGNMRGWRHSDVYEANLIRFFELRNVLPFFEAMTMNRHGTVHPDLMHLGIQLGEWIGHTRAGNVSAPKGQEIERTPVRTGPLMCQFTPFYDQNVVLPNGDVALCCADYSLRHRVGNLLEQDYYDIFSSPAMGALRAENMKIGGRSLCHTCNRAKPLRTGPTKQFWVG